MPLNITVPNAALYSNALLEEIPTIEEQMNAITGLVGAYDAASLTQAATVPLWTPRYGATTASQSSSTRQPTAATVDGIAVIQNGTLSKNMVIDKTFVSGAALTVGARFKIENTTQDVQAVFGNSSWRLLWRTAPRIQFDAVNDILVEGLTAGWHTVLNMQRTDTTHMMFNGQLYTAANAGAALTQVIIGASSPTGTANGFLGSISKMIVAEANLYNTTHKTTALNFLNAGV